MIHTMKTIQIVIDDKLLKATDRAAKQAKMNRSALVREALRHYLKQLHSREQERRDRQGYERHPDTEPELAVWEEVAAWPED
ncbi:ribbon-helix-helix protein, CopG family [Acidobacteria bacterium AH-259-L09]|nr:ribbon-helix-helix protein, CopG family [Acidobacteria bacterium AH-259-L09]